MLVPSIRDVELEIEELSIIGLIVISIISLIHTSQLSIQIVLPIIGVLLIIVLIKFFTTIIFDYLKDKTKINK
jgi:hypothetical protein